MTEGAGVYVAGTGWLHRLDPVPKLLWLIWGVVAPFVLPTAFTYALLVVAIALGLSARLGATYLRRVLLSSLLLATSIVVVNAFFLPGARDVVATLGPLRVTREGLEFGLPIAARVVAAIALSLAFVMSTRPDDLMEALVQRGAPPKLAFVVLSTIQTVPRMLAKAGRILDAQQARGLRTRGSVGARIGSVVPLLGPLVIGSLIDVRERSFALEARGFGSGTRRTAYRVVPTTATDRALLLLVALAFLALPIYLAARLMRLVP